MNRLLAPTLYPAFAARVAAAPERLALMFEGSSWTAARLLAETQRQARRLTAQGLGQGERVLLMMDNGPSFLCAFLACQMLGLIAVPASPKSPLARIRYLLADSGARRILVESLLPARIRAQHSAESHASLLLTLDEADAQTDCAPDCAPYPAQAQDCALIQYTSGSSGDSKGVMISHRAALANIQAFSARMELADGEIFSSLLPLFHDMGLMCFGLAPLLYGHTLVLHRCESISMRPWLSTIGELGVHLTGAPDSLLQLANRVVDQPEEFNLSSLRMLICGSEPVRRASIETFGSRFGIFAAIKPAYGMAELTLCASLTGRHETAQIDSQGQVASGRAIDEVEIRIAVGEAPQDGPAVGEILVRSPSAMSGYWQKPEASAAAFDPDGFLHTGDLGYLDERGFLYVIGRQKNMLVRNGEKHSPHDLESAAQELPAIRRAAVVQSQAAASAIIAVLEVDRNLLADPPRLAGLAKEYRQASFRRAGLSPDACWFVGSGAIPCTENGKMRHANLRERIDLGQFKPHWSDLPVSASHGADLV